MFVLGCHRSGTSLLASIISDVLPKQQNVQQSSVLSPQIDNPGGFFESRQLVELNEALLRELGIHWQIPPLHPIHWQCADIFPRLFEARQSFAKQALNHSWVDKDPRLCLTYPAFQHILLKRTPIAAIIRHPHEVAGSLQTRDIIPLAKGLVIWFLYNQHISREICTDDHLISYQSLVAFDEDSIRGLANYITKIIPNSSCTNELLMKTVRLRAQPEWRRNTSTKPSTLLPEMEWSEVANTCIERYEEVKNNNFNIETFRSIFADTPDAILRACAVLGWQQTHRPHADLDGELKRANTEIKNLKESSSWKITKYLRWAADKLK